MSICLVAAAKAMCPSSFVSLALCEQYVYAICRHTQNVVDIFSRIFLDPGTGLQAQRTLFFLLVFLFRLLLLSDFLFPKALSFLN